MMNIIWIHGFGEDSSVWEDFKSGIHSYYQSFLFEYSQKTGHNSIHNYAQDLAFYIREKQIDKPVLIGHSMGGYIALEYAAQYPETLSGLGLFHSTAAADTDPKKAERDKTKTFIKTHGTETFLRSFYPNMFTEEFRRTNAEIVENNLSRLTAINPEALISATESMKNRNDHTQTLSLLTFPVFQILGKQDSFVPLEKALHQTTLLRKPYTLVLDNAAHAGMFESPSICAAFINNFLESIS